MTKRRFLIKKFKTYRAAVLYTGSGTAKEAAKTGELQIRRKSDGFHLVVRREV